MLQWYLQLLMCPYQNQNYMIIKRRHNYKKLTDRKNVNMKLDIMWNKHILIKDLH